MIWESGEDISRERDFKMLICMLLGPRDFPDVKRETISEGTEGAMRKECPTLLFMKVAEDLLILVLFSNVMSNSNNKFSKTVCNNCWIRSNSTI